MSSPPRVSVVMGAYNSAPYLEATVESILRQTYADFEFIIIDDASTDDTWSILEKLAAQDARIGLHRNPVNLGISHTRNLGTDLARGEFIAVMDHDDISAARRLEKEVTYLDAHPDVGVIGGAVRRLVGDNAAPLRNIHYPVTPQLSTWILCFESPLSHPASMIRRALLIEVGGYRPEFVTANDYDLWQRLSRVTHLASLPDIVLDYRWHGENTLLRRVEDGRRETVSIAQRAMEYVYGQQVPLEIVRQLLRYHSSPPQDMRVLSRTVYALAMRFREQERLTQAEWASIRGDAARRILHLLRHHPGVEGRATALVYAARLDPVHTARWSQSMVRKAVQSKLAVSSQV
ncbi:MAG: glycosyltransferase [Caldilineaceae bacterium]|nr:glycosyltransferase [Caldilineaceae bacterium]